MKQKKEFVFSKQLLRSGTVIGVLQSEACFAESKADFIHKYGIEQKECNESIYWLKLLSRTNYIAQNEFEILENDVIELFKMITSSIITVKRNTNR